jgi:hypothetical protein
VVDGAVAAQRDGEQVVEPYAGGVRDLEAAVGMDGRVDVEEAVAAQAQRGVEGRALSLRRSLVHVDIECQEVRDTA